MKSIVLDPKKQAEKMLKQFEEFTPNGFQYYYSKECALIELNDILSAVETPEKIQYWKQTKKELKKL